MTLQINGTAVVNLDRSFVLGTATPGSPVTGLIRWSTTNSQFEVYNGSAWVAIMSAGSASSPVWSWGRNLYSALGVGEITTIVRSSPVSVIGGVTDWAQISVSSHTVNAIRASGELWAWGDGRGGELADGSSGLSYRKSSPAWSSSARTYRQLNVAVAIASNGTAWAWGSGGSGQIGDNTATGKSNATAVVGGFTDWRQVSAGWIHKLGVRANGTAWAWGSGSSGQLGDNTSVNKSSPVSVVGGFTDWIKVDGGTAHSAGLRGNGSIWAWGANTQGQLGDNTATAKSSPVAVVGGFTDWIDVAAGSYSTLGLRANGTAWGWGRNNYGQLGDNSTTSRSSPVSVVGGFTDWSQVRMAKLSASSLTAVFSVGIRSNGSAWAWGRNNYGQLGDNTTTNRSSPVSVVGGFTDWVQLAPGTYHVTGLRAI